MSVPVNVIAIANNHHPAVIGSFGNSFIIQPGEGFFAVNLPDGTIGYTKNGIFRLNQDRKLQEINGYSLQDNITIPNVSLSDISISAATGLITDANENIIGQLLVHKFDHEGLLENIGDGFFRETEGSGEPHEEIPVAGMITEIFIHPQH